MPAKNHKKGNILLIYEPVSLIRIKDTFVIFDTEDLDLIQQYTWHIDRYPTTTVSGKHIRLHKLLFPDLKIIDHVNGNKLDNRKENLRSCSNQENSRNKKLTSYNTSGYKGVTYFKRDNTWRAYIKIDGKQKHLGYFNTVEEAYNAYCIAAKLYFKEFANL